MTNEELIQDFKQFISATMSQEVVGLRKDLKTDIRSLDEKLSTDIKALDEKLSTNIRSLDEKLDTIQDAVADTLTHTTEETDAKLEDHEQRLRRLEHRAA